MSVDKYKISVILVSYNMQRELPRTLQTLLPGYQLNIQKDDYELIVIDNGSKEPVRIDDYYFNQANLQLIHAENPQVSPVSVINEVITKAKGENIAVMIDGARMISPGFLSQALKLLQISPYTVVTAMGYHLGSKAQHLSVSEGYCQSVEDELLETVDWLGDGYELFNISALAASSASGVFEPLSESNSIAVSRKLWDEINGFEEKFVAPAGGLANLDLYKRLCEHPKSEVYMLIGEGSFHQFHGGVSTNTPGGRFSEYEKEYINIRGEQYFKPLVSPIAYGQPATQALKFIEDSARNSLNIRNNFNRNKVDLAAVSNNQSVNLVLFLGLFSINRSDFNSRFKNIFPVEFSELAHSLSNQYLGTTEMSAYYNAAMSNYWFNLQTKPFLFDELHPKISALGKSEVDVLYEPLISRTVSCWLAAFDDSKHETTPVIILSNPYVFAEKQSKSMGISYEASLLFWFYSMMEVERNTRSRKRLFLQEVSLLNLSGEDFGAEIMSISNGICNIVSAAVSEDCVGHGEDNKSLIYKLYGLLIPLIKEDAIKHHEALDVFYQKLSEYDEIISYEVGVLSGVIEYKNSVIDEQHLGREDLLVKLDRVENWSSRYRYAGWRKYVAVFRRIVSALKRRLKAI